MANTGDCVRQLLLNYGLSRNFAAEYWAEEEEELQNSISDLLRCVFVSVDDKQGRERKPKSSIAIHILYGVIVLCFRYSTQSDNLLKNNQTKNNIKNKRRKH